MPYLIMCKLLKSTGFYWSSIPSNFLNKKKFLINNCIFISDFKHYKWTKLPSSFLSPEFERLPFRSSNCILHIWRKNHFQPKTQKMVYKPEFKSKEKELLHNELLSSLPKCKSVEEQIKVFSSLVRLPKENINHRYSICSDLEKNLHPYFPSCSVHLIGSSVNNFGIKGCDVDLSLELPNENTEKVSPIENVCLNEELLEPRTHGTKKLASKIKLKTIRKILQGLKYEGPMPVIAGRCPILNFTVGSLPCDLSVSNSSANHSTNLMLLCGKLDERVVPLLQIIFYWAKQSKLVGGPLKFKTYAIFLMVIYFLKTRNPPVLPSVETMFEKTEFLKNLENWSYDVTQYLNQFEKTKNNQTVAQLLREFFIFYGNFDFSNVICPMSGTSMSIKVFAEKVNSNKFESNTISIQDPLDPEWNVTTGVAWTYCKNFQKAIISVWEKYQEPNCWIPGSDDWGLTLFINSNYSIDKLRDIKEFSIDLPLTATVENFAQRNALDRLVKAASNLQYILSYCLQFQCYTFNADININELDLPLKVKTAVENLFFKNDTIYNSLKLNSAIQVDNCKDEVLHVVSRYICITKDTWSGRSSFIPFSNASKNLFDIEYEISKQILLEKENNDKEMFYFLCECFGVTVENSVCFRLIFKPLNNDRFVPKLAVFLKEYIPELMSKSVL